MSLNVENYAGFAGKEICLTKYLPFELVLFFPQETSWRVKQYSSAFLTNYRIHLCPIGKGRHSIHSSKSYSGNAHQAL